MKIEKDVWVVMTKDNKMIAKGVPRSRYLIPVDDKKDNKRIITYSSEGKANANKTGFYGQWTNGYTDEDMKTVKATITINIDIE